MSKYIDYDQYQQIVHQQQSPKNNLFEQNRNLFTQVTNLKQQLAHFQKQSEQLRAINNSLLNAIKRVFSPALAEQITHIIQQGWGETQSLTQSFYELFVSHQSIPTVSDWSENHHDKEQYSRTPRKSISQRIPLSPISSAKYNNSSSFQSMRDSSSCKSNTSKLIATQIMCQICDETFGPVEFLSHAEKCKQLSFIGQSQSQNLQNLEDTQDRDIQKKKKQFVEMMKNLIKIRSQIEDQIKMLKFSKEKIDRAAQKRKLQKQLAKVISIINKKQGKLKGTNTFNGIKSGKLGKSKKNSSMKFKP